MNVNEWVSGKRKGRGKPEIYLDRLVGRPGSARHRQTPRLPGGLQASTLPLNSRASPIRSATRAILDTLQIRIRLLVDSTILNFRFLKALAAGSFLNERCGNVYNIYMCVFERLDASRMYIGIYMVPSTKNITVIRISGILNNHCFFHGQAS